MTETLTDLFGLPPGGEWQNRAACADSSELFNTAVETGESDLAVRICRRCPVRRECLDHALEHDERFGIWGGLNVRERNRLRRSRPRGHQD